MFAFRFGRKENKVFGAEARQVRIVPLIGYLGIFCLIPLFSKDRLSKYHAKQGLAILLMEIFFTVGILLAASIAKYASIWHSAMIWATILFWLGATGLRVIGISYAARGMDKDVPLAGYLAKKLFHF
ncbi:MAG TPA: hypothetical protein P5080_02975 [Candidatus Paceibacterota bacterium]|nr:hypothetical protein [Candidatus Paceibacterota bacterium]HSA36652.1 hypothetical protein [Candidatus Paceibacterota bacterium]